MSDNIELHAEQSVESGSLHELPTAKWSESTQKIVGVCTVVFLGLACFTSGYLAAKLRN